MILLQKYDSALKNRVIKIQIKKGQKIIVPAGYTCSIINSRQASTLIVLELHPREAKPRVVLVMGEWLYILEERKTGNS